MTENEAIEELRKNIEMPFGSDISNETSEMAIAALEETQQYRTLGTPEELRTKIARLETEVKELQATIRYSSDSYAAC